MGNEMGNQNASGLKGEENEATDQNEKVHQEATPGGEVKGENHIIPEGQNKDYNEKAAELSNHDVPSDIDSDLKVPTSIEKEDDDEDPKPVLKDEEGSVCEDGDDIKKATVRDGNNREEFVEDKIAKIAIEVLENNPSSTRDLKPEEHESADVPTEGAERDHDLTFRESTETQKGMSVVGTVKENGLLVYKDNAQDHSADDNQLEEEMRVELEDKKSLAMSNFDKKYDISSPGNTAENGASSEANGELQPETKAADSSESNLENAAETSLLDSIKEESINPIDEFKLIASEAENRESKHDLIQNEGAADSSLMMESCQMKNVEKSSLSVNSAAVLKEVEHTEEAKVINNESQTCLACDNLNSLPEAVVDGKEIIGLRPEVGMPAGISITAMNREEEKPTEEGMMQNAREEKDKPYATGNGSKEEGRVDKPFSPLQSSNEEKFLDISRPEASYVKVGHKRTESSPFLNANDAIRVMPTTDAVMQNQEAEREMEQKIHSTLAEAELPPSKQPHQQYANREATLSAVVAPTKTPESGGRHSVESNPEKPCERIELTKCPSFDFGIPLDARSEESDQTPLLRQDKTIYRSFSSISNVTFHSENGRSSLDYEPAVVEEKTIRMERSDSDNSRAPFFSSMKKDDTSNAASTPQKEENHVGSKKLVNESGSSPANGHEFGSPRSSGKRKPKSSLFSTCLCCTAAIS